MVEASALAHSLGGQMKTVLAAMALVVVLAGCENRGDRDTGHAADTSVTTRSTQDTTIVTSDTTVDTDTTVREGEMKRDTAKAH
jgi:uncharacterized lipoprotein NlpE involved in copper resistance